MAPLRRRFSVAVAFGENPSPPGDSGSTGRPGSSNDYAVHRAAADAVAAGS
jgi:hypothetical protein